MTVILKKQKNQCTAFINDKDRKNIKYINTYIHMYTYKAGAKSVSWSCLSQL